MLEIPCATSCIIMGCYRVVGRKREHRGVVEIETVLETLKLSFVSTSAFNLNPFNDESKLGIQRNLDFSGFWMYNMVVPGTASNKH